jgi:hypothetical protein
MAGIISKWKKPDTDIPAPTQFSVRPTVKVAAQINALADMFPRRTKTQIINDLIEYGLTQTREEIAGKFLGAQFEADGVTEFASYENQEEWDLFIESRDKQESLLMEKIQADEAKKKGGKK